jgi:hypothetical protein
MIRSLALIACGIAAPIASADTIDAAFLGTQAGQNVRTILAGNTRDVFSGQILYSLANGTGAAAALSGNYVTFCSELTELVNAATLGYEVFEIPASSFPNASPLNADRTQAVANLYAAYGDTAISTGDAAFASAFQITVWEIIYDFDPGMGMSSIDVGAGSLTVTNTDTSALAPSIAAYVSAFASAAVTPGSQNGLFSIRNSGAQDQIVLVPAPGSIALLGISGLVAGRRRR